MIKQQQLQLTAIANRSDNYAWGISDDHHALVVDPGAAHPVLTWLRREQLDCFAIMITHTHIDHIQGVVEILTEFPEARLLSPRGSLPSRLLGHRGYVAMSAGNYKLIDLLFSRAETSYVNREQLASHWNHVSAEIIATPGHCPDHHCIRLEPAKLLLSGDLLFSMGCGRVIDGSLAELWQSLQRLQQLPGDLQVACGHEYTLKNCQFAASIFGDDPAIIAKLRQVEQQHAARQATVPVQLAAEFAVNPFLRCGSTELQRQAQQHGAPTSAYELFCWLRRRRDNF